MNSLSTLYCRDINGNILQHDIEVIHEENDVYILISYGHINGNKCQVKSVIDNDKSLFLRSKQAEVEAKSRHTLKRKHGYKSLEDLGITDIHNLFEVLPTYNTDADFQLKPMKAQKVMTYEEANELSYPMIGQPKINGIRCMARLEVVNETTLFTKSNSRLVLRSKEGHEYVLPHISTALSELLHTYHIKDLVFDGELYIPYKKLNEIKASVPMVNSHGTLSRCSNDKNLVQYWVFDLAIEESYQNYRLEILHELIPMNTLIHHKYIRNTLIGVYNKPINNADEAVAFRDECIKEGFEGCILRQPHATYAFGQRAKTMVKMKKCLDSEFLIVDIIGKPKEPETALFVLKNDLNDELFECNPEGSYKVRKDYLTYKEKYIGKLATVKYYERSGVKRVPFHANCWLEVVRDYE